MTTGLFPMRLASWHDAQHVVMRPGEVGTVDVSRTDGKGRFRIEVTPAIPLWFWITLIVACFLPALSTLCRRPVGTVSP